MKRFVLFSLDVEEFDLPLEAGQALSLESQVEITSCGLDAADALLRRHGVRATLFTTATFAEARPEVIRKLGIRHEIASHGCRHARLEEGDLEQSRRRLTNLTGSVISGFRAPRMALPAAARLEEAGYAYDASLNPTWIPGRFNHFFEPRTLYRRGNIMEIPASVTPFFRIPLFWFAFKVLPLKLMITLSLWTLRHDGVLSIYFHPWEFYDLRGFAIPRIIRTVSGERMAEKIDLFLNILSKEAAFVSCNDYLNLREIVR
jgi:peptidoglycan/xylan/chitin deacetylase (PgdA/CDA1 family)